MNLNELIINFFNFRSWIKSLNSMKKLYMSIRISLLCFHRRWWDWMIFWGGRKRRLIDILGRRGIIKGGRGSFKEKYENYNKTEVKKQKLSNKNSLPKNQTPQNFNPK